MTKAPLFSIAPLVFANLTSAQLLGSDTTQAPSSTATPNQETLIANDALDRVKVLERLREIDAEEATAKAKSNPIIQANASGLLFRSADTAWSIRFRGVVRSSAVWDLNDEEHNTVDQFQNHTVRLGFEGNLAKKIGYRIQADFSKGSVGLQDAYSDINFSKWFQLRIGKFQVPLGWERYQSPGDLLFLDRAYPSSIAPNRDIGAQISGEVLQGRLQYAIAGVNGGADGSNINDDVNDDKDGYARLWVNPGKGTNLAWVEGLGFGVAGSFGYHDARLASYRSPAGATIYSWLAADSARGEGWRIAPQVSWTAGPFWIYGEWAQSLESVTKGTLSASTDSVGTGSANKGIVYRYTKVTNGANAQEFGVQAFQGAASWVVTGEDASEKGVKPRHPFDGSATGGWGALELSARISGIQFDNNAFPIFVDTAKSVKSSLSWAFATNWHLVKGTRLQVSFERTTFEGGSSKVIGKDSKKKDILAVRDRKPENILAIVASTSF